MPTTTQRPLATRPSGDSGCALTIDVRSLARALGGEYGGQDRIGPYLLAPGPSHSRIDRSLKVTICSDAADGFWVHSFADDDPLQCRDHVRAAAGLPAWSPRRDRAPSPAPAPRPPEPDEEHKAAWLRSRILSIWDEARDPRGTIVERYLTAPKSEGGRGLQFPDDVAGRAIRFHPACPWKQNDGETIRVPAMVSAMRTIDGDKLVAVHRTWLTPDGCKVDRRMLGPSGGAAIKLDPDDAVTMGLVIGEGVETCLAARQIGFRPVWATGSSGGIKSFPVLSGVDALTILGEADPNGANERAVTECGTRWHEAGRGVIVAAPLHGKDINDAINGAAA